jgi:hypothetical protein
LNWSRLSIKVNTWQGSQRNWRLGEVDWWCPWAYVGRSESLFLSYTLNKLWSYVGYKGELLHFSNSDYK